MAGGTAAATQPPVLRASGLGKAFLLTRSRVRPLLRRIVSGGRGAPPEGAFWAVRDVSFEIARGESLGLIGRNGSGKSTLLRMLGRVARPTTGFVESTSRLACLLDLGVGFHALETGRQNAEAWLMLLAGMRRGEARRATLEVERFAEIGDHFDRPLRTYSAGMQMRVAFAVATLLSPEVLVADEVLAVGDAAFQKRCEAFFDRFLTGGGSLILCAHDMHQIQRLCGRTLWLDGGRTMRIGDSRDVVRHYRAAVAGGTGAAPDPDRPAGGAIHEIGESRGLPFEVVDLHLRDESGRELRVVDSGTTVVVEADVVAPAAVPHVHLSFVRGDGVPVYGVSSDMDGARPASLGGGRFRFRLTFPELPLLAGGYVLKAHALDETATRVYDTVEIAFEVLGAPHEGGLVRVPAEWH